MPTISVQFSESEYKLVSQHVKRKGMTISQYIKVMLLEQNEDEYDDSIAKTYVQEKDSIKYLKFEESSKEWDLE